MEKIWKRIVSFVLVVGMVLTTNGITGLAPVSAAVVNSDEEFEIEIAEAENASKVVLGSTGGITVTVKPKDSSTTSISFVNCTDTDLNTKKSTTVDSYTGQEIKLSDVKSEGKHTLEVSINYKKNGTSAPGKTLKCEYEIFKNISDATIVLNPSYAYTGAEIKPVTVRSEGTLLEEGGQYTTVYMARTPNDSYIEANNNYSVNVFIYGAGYYTGTASGSFKILAADFENGDTDVWYNGTLCNYVKYVPIIGNPGGTTADAMNITVRAYAYTDRTCTQPLTDANGKQITYDIPAGNYTSTLTTTTKDGGECLVVKVTGTNNCTGTTDTTIPLSLANATITGKGTNDVVTGTYSPDGDYFNKESGDGLASVTVPDTYITADGTFSVPTDWLQIKPNGTGTIGTNNTATVSAREEYTDRYTGSKTISYELKPRNMTAIDKTVEDWIVVSGRQVKTTNPADLAGKGIKIVDKGIGTDGEPYERELVQDVDFTVTGIINPDNNDTYGLELTGQGFYTGKTETGPEDFTFGKSIGKATITSMVDEEGHYCSNEISTEAETVGLRTNKPETIPGVGVTVVYRAIYTGYFIQPKIELSGEGLKDAVQIGDGKTEGTKQIFYYGLEDDASTSDTDGDGIPDNAAYSVTYEKNMGVTSGSNYATVTIKGVNEYAGEDIVYFTINGMSLPSTAGNKEFQLVCKNDSGEYEIYQHPYNGWRMTLTDAFLKEKDFKIQRTFLMDDNGTTETEILDAAIGTNASERNNYDFYLAHDDENSSVGTTNLKVGLTSKIGTMKNLFNSTVGTFYYEIVQRDIVEVFTSGTGVNANNEYDFKNEEYTGTDVIASINVRLNDGEEERRLIRNTDYTVSAYKSSVEDETEQAEWRENNKKVGSTIVNGETITGFSTIDYFDETKYEVTKGPRIVIEGKGNYTGTMYYYFTILPKSLASDITIADVPYIARAITAKDLEQWTAVKSNDGLSLTPNKDYSITLAGNTVPMNPGTAYNAVITGINDYGGSSTVPFNIKYNIAPQSTSTAASGSGGSSGGSDSSGDDADSDDDSDAGDSSGTGSSSGTTTTNNGDQGYVIISIDSTYWFKIQNGNVYRLAGTADNGEKDRDGYLLDPIGTVTSVGTTIVGGNVVPNVSFEMKYPTADGAETAEYGFTNRQIRPAVTSVRYYNTSGVPQKDELLRQKPEEESGASQNYDYSVVYGANVNQSDFGTILIAAEDNSNFMGRIELKFKIGTTTLSEDDVVITGTNGIGRFYYTGSQIKPKSSDITIAKTGSTLIEGTDYNIVCGKNLDVKGNGTENYVKIIFIGPGFRFEDEDGNITDTIQKEITIDPLPLDSDNITVTVPEEEFDGTMKTPKPTLTLKTEGYDDYTLKADTDYQTVTASFANVAENTTYNTGISHNFKISAMPENEQDPPNFTGSRDADFKIYYNLKNTTIEWYKNGNRQNVARMQFPYSPKEGGVIPQGLTDDTLWTSASQLRGRTGFILRANVASDAVVDAPAIPVNAYTVTATNNTTLSDGIANNAILTVTANAATGWAKEGTLQQAAFEVIRNNLNEGQEIWGANMPEMDVAFEKVTFDNTEKSPEVTVSYDGVPLEYGTDYTLNYCANSNRLRVDATADKDEEDKPYVTITAATNSTNYSTYRVDENGVVEEDNRGNPIVASIQKTFEIDPKELTNQDDINIIDFANVITMETAEENGQFLSLQKIREMFMYGDDTYVTFDPSMSTSQAAYYAQSDDPKFRLEDTAVSGVYQLIGGKDYDIRLLTGSTSNNNYTYRFLLKGNYKGEIIQPFAAKHQFIEWLGEDDKTGKVTVEVTGSGSEYLQSQMVDGVPQKDLGNVLFLNIREVLANTRYNLTYGTNTPLNQTSHYDVTYNLDGYIYPGLMTVYFTPKPESVYNQEQSITKTFGVIGDLSRSEQVDIVYDGEPIWTDNGPLAENLVVSWKATDSSGSATDKKVTVNSSWYQITKKTYLNGTQVIMTEENGVRTMNVTGITPTEVVVEIVSSGTSDYCINSGTYRVPFANGTVTEPDDTRINLATADLRIQLTPEEFTYDGRVHEPIVTVSMINAQGTEVGLTEGTDFTITYQGDKISPGEQQLIIAAKEDSTKYRGSVIASYQINSPDTIDISGAEVILEPEEFTYDGAEHKPAVTVMLDGVTLAESDYTLSWGSSDYTTSGAKKITIRAANTLKYRGSLTVYYDIKPQNASDDTSIKNAVVQYSPTTFAADGTDKKPSLITVRMGNTTLVEGQDYTVDWTSDEYVTEGEKEFTIIGMDPYWGYQVVPYTVGSPSSSKTSLASADVTLSPTSFVEDGSEHKPAVTVKVGTTELVQGTDYTLDWISDDYKTSGTKYVRVMAASGSELYEGYRDVPFTIYTNGSDVVDPGKIDISGGVLELETTSCKYTGQALRPSIVSVRVNGVTLQEGVDYTAGYYNNTNIGTGVVIVNGIGKYTGILVGTFTISVTGTVTPGNPDGAIDISSINAVSIQGIANSYVYTGSAIEPKPGVTTTARVRLQEGVDYEVIYVNNKNVGTAAAIIAAKGSDYIGAITTYYGIWKKAINLCTISMSTSDRIYSGKAFTPSVTIKDGTRKLVAGVDYTITYKNNINAGVATAVVQGEGNYKDTKNINFRIVLGKVENVQFTSSKKKAVTLKWNKVSQATGYEVYTSDRKTKVATVKTTTAQITGLKPGVQYKYKVRAYIKQGSETIYGDFSNIVVSATNPKKATLSVANIGVKAVRLKWSKVKGSGYVIYRATSKNGKYKKIKAVSSSSKIKYKDNSVVSGKTYYYRVRAYRKAGSQKVYGAYSKKIGIVAR